MNRRVSFSCESDAGLGVGVAERKKKRSMLKLWIFKFQRSNSFSPATFFRQIGATIVGVLPSFLPSFSTHTQEAILAQGVFFCWLGKIALACRDAWFPAPAESRSHWGLHRLSQLFLLFFAEIQFCFKLSLELEVEENQNVAVGSYNDVSNTSEMRYIEKKIYIIPPMSAVACIKKFKIQNSGMMLQSFIQISYVRM